MGTDALGFVRWLGIVLRGFYTNKEINSDSVSMEIKNEESRPTLARPFDEVNSNISETLSVLKDIRDLFNKEFVDKL